MSTDRPPQPAAQPQQPPDCEKCGRRKRQESKDVGNTEGTQESEETGFRWFNSISVKVQGLFGLNTEQEVSQKDIETQHENESENTQAYFNVCPNIHCEQHIEDNWDIRRWELRNNSESKLSEKDKIDKYMELKDDLLGYRMATNIGYEPSIDSPDFKSSEQTSEQADSTTATDSSPSSSTDETETATDQTATGVGDRVRQWWAENRVRQWVSSRSNNGTHTGTTESTNADTTNTQSNQNQSETDEQQTSLWEYSTDAQVGLSQGEVGQGTNDDYRGANTGMGSSTSKSEDFDNDRSNSL